MQANNKNIFALPLRVALLVLLLWVIVYYQGIVTAVKVWSISEIFTHCFLVLPCAFYFIFQKRYQIMAHEWRPNYWLLPFLLGALFLQLFGYVGDIQLFMHIATFSSLPLIIWMVIGNKAANEIRFPLFLMLFAIPVGEQLVPYLQLITTDMAVPLIELSGVPIYRNGFYLEIPEGKFLVAEACSGISFLIASVVFGCLYAYVSFSRLSKQLLFVLVSIIVPILANAVRVYGIVLTAHLTDMEYAAGADHIIYGGIFYGIIIFILIIIGERFRDKKFVDSELSLKNNELKDLRVNWRILSLISVVFALQLLWQSSIENREIQTSNHQAVINLKALPFNVLATKKSDWQPNYIGASETQRGYFIDPDSTAIDFYFASYSNPKAELISSMNLLFDKELWSMLSQQTIRVPQMNANVVLTKLVSVQGKYRYIAHWYEFTERIYTSQIKLKLTQTFLRLFGSEQTGALIAFSTQDSKNDEGAAKALLQFLSVNAAYISGVIEQN